MWSGPPGYKPGPTRIEEDLIGPQVLAAATATLRLLLAERATVQEQWVVRARHHKPKLMKNAIQGPRNQVNVCPPSLGSEFYGRGATLLSGHGFSIPLNDLIWILSLLGLYADS